ncbi:MAG: ComEC/Rec2 family competence protein [Planctomycetes bacterium]|nr:ComEC/Rec2 family competence protein [Planctomycetota bacterium]
MGGACARRPLVLVSLGLVAGVLAADSDWVPRGPALLALLVGLPAALLGLRAGPWRVAPPGEPCGRARGGPVLASLTLAALGVGALAYHGRVTGRTDGVQAHAGPAAGLLVRVRGEVAGLPSQDLRHGRARTAFDLRLCAALGPEGWGPAAGLARVIAGGVADGVFPGDRLELVGRRRPLPVATNPGQGDISATLRRRGVRCLIDVDEPEGLVRHGPPRHGPVRGLAVLRAGLARGLDRVAREPGRSLIKTLILGERSGLDAETARAWQRAGIAHYLAISGLHVAAAAGAAWWLLARLGIPRRLASAGVLAVVALYAGLAGLRASTFRAGVMVGCMVAGEAVGRRGDPLSALALAATLTILGDPSQVFEPGFQLSYVAVLGILLLMAPLGSLRGGRGGLAERLADAHTPWGLWRLAPALRGAVGVSLCAALATTPLVARHFHLVSLVVVPANLLAAPAVSILLALGAATTVLAVPCPGLAAALAWPCEGAARYLQGLGRLAESLPGSWLPVPPPPGWWTLVWYLLLAAAALATPGGVGTASGPERLRRGVVVAALSGLVSLLVLLAWPWTAPPREARLTVLDVGRGTAIHLELPGAGHLLYDVGPPLAGERRIAPYLWSRGVRGLDAVLLSHSDLDHVGGLEEVLDRFRVGRVLIPWGFGLGPEGLRVVEGLRARRVPVLVVRGAGPRLGPLRTLAPAGAPGAACPADNDGSLVALLDWRGSRLLLTGDLQREGIGQLLASGWDLRAAVLQVPHHGRAEPALRGLLDRVRPRLALTDGGSHGAAPGTLGLLAAHGVEVLSTQGQGALSLAWDEGRGTWEARGFLDGPVVPPGGR